MAIDISDDVRTTFGPRAQPLNHALLRARPVRSAVRRSLRALNRSHGIAVQSQPEVHSAFEAAAPGFSDEEWAFVDPFFTPDFAAELRETWPARSFFEPMKTILKSYDFGFRWERGAPLPDELSRFSALRRTYELFLTDDLARRISAFCGDGIERSCYSMVCTWAVPGSALIPHRDTIATDPAGASFVNFVVFVDGTGGSHAGGTCILGDNTFERTVFEPTNLRNTALVYRSSAPFWHGFRPMRSGTFRWTFNAQFAAVDYDG